MVSKLCSVLVCGLLLTYRVSTPATFGSSLDTISTVFGIGVDALVALCMWNKQEKSQSLGSSFPLGKFSSFESLQLDVN